MSEKLNVVECSEGQESGVDALTAIIISANDDNIDDLLDALSSSPFVE